MVSIDWRGGRGGVPPKCDKKIGDRGGVKKSKNMSRAMLPNKKRGQKTPKIDKKVAISSGKTTFLVLRGIFVKKVKILQKVLGRPRGLEKNEFLLRFFFSQKVKK